MSGGPTPVAPPVAAATASARVAAELAGAGVSAVIAYHSSVYRARGIASVAGLLPWDSANRQVQRMAPGIVQGAGRTSVVATVCANDAIFQVPDVLASLADVGVIGVLNAPTVGLFTGPVRDALERAGLGRECEIALIGAAHRAGLRAWCYVFDERWTEQAVTAGADVIVIHLGLTGVRTPYESTDVASCLAVLDALRPTTPVYLHGGRLTEPADFTRLIDELGATGRTPPVGFFGASTFEQPGTKPSVAVQRWRAHLQEVNRDYSG